MQLRPSKVRTRRLSSETREPQQAKNLLEMQRSTNSQQHSPLSSGTGNGVSSSQAAVLTKAPVEGVGESNSGDVHIPINLLQGDHDGSNMSRQHHHSSSHSHLHSHSHSHSDTESAEDSGSDSGEHNSSLSELRCIFQWLQKSLPFILILSAKLIIQHALGIAVGIGLLTTFLYANKSIVNQVFLQEKHSKLQCVWLLVFLTASSILLYYTFYPQSLYYSLFFMNPTMTFLQLWDVIWIVGITDFILKFICMGCKCLIMLLPSFMMSYNSKGQWFMFIEEVSQYYRLLAPLPVWARYLSGYLEPEGLTGWTLGILLALCYLILKLLGIFMRWRTFKKALQIFCSQQGRGVIASKRQCSEAGGICSICQGEFRGPVLLICQHIFCEECISLWFSREKTCPLCRTVITDSVHKWKDGATSPHLQMY